VPRLAAKSPHVTAQNSKPTIRVRYSTRGTAGEPASEVAVTNIQKPQMNTYEHR
jgi:hypothetical protein